MADEIRKDFPILKKKANGKPLIYLDNAATTQKPKQVIGRVNEFLSEEYSNIHRGMYGLAQNASEEYESVREIVADFVGSEKEEIIFTKSSTEGFNLLASTLPELFEGKEIVLTEMEHHANLIPWQIVAKKFGMNLRFIPLKEDFTLDYEEAERIISKDTALVSIVHMSNVLGTVNDAKKIYDLSKDKGAFFVLDATQSVAHMNVKSDMADFVLFSSHKMGGPSGVGVLCGKKEILEKMPPYKYGGDMIKEVTYNDASFAEIPAKFEPGTPNIEGTVGLGEAVKYINSLGYDEISKHEKDITRYAFDNLSKTEGIKIYSGENSGSIISFLVEGVHSHDVASLLDDYGVCIRAGHHCCMPLMKKLGVSSLCRVSFWVYNTKKEVDVLVEALQEIKKRFELK